MAVQDRPYIQLLQVCLLDLDYNLPVQVRDQALAEAGEVIEALPQSDAGREYALNRMQQEGNTESSFGQGAANNDTILRLQRTTPYYKVAEYCSLWMALAEALRMQCCACCCAFKPALDGIKGWSC